MFKAVKESDGYGNKQTHYYLTKGDSCTITATPQKGGVIVSSEVKKCVFKLANSNYQMLTTPDVFPIEMTKSGDSFVLNLTSAISSTNTSPSSTILLSGFKNLDSCTLKIA